MTMMLPQFPVPGGRVHSSYNYEAAMLGDGREMTNLLRNAFKEELAVIHEMD